MKTLPALKAFTILIALAASPTVGSAQTPAPKRGGTAVISVDPSGFQMLNTHMTSGIPAQVVSPLWADGLYARNGKAEKVPRLATSWTVSDDALTYTFKLRSGVKWSDGMPFSAEDAVFTMMNLSRFNTYMATVLPFVDKAEAPDATTFVVKMKKPVAAMLEVFNKETFPLYPKHIYEKGEPTTNPANRAPVGLGPFKFVSWEQGRQLIFTRNENYWDQPKPYLDGVVVALIPNAQQQINALIQGEIDWAAVPFSQYQRVQDATKTGKIDIKRLEFASPSRLNIDFNLTRSPMSNLKVRQALVMAIDRKRIAADAYHGMAYAETNAIAAQFKELQDPSVNYETMYPFDLKRAAALLDEAGFPVKDGKRFTVEFTYGGSGTSLGLVYVDAANIISAAWKEIGIDVKIAALDGGIWNKKVYGERDFDISMTSLTSTFDPTFGVDRSFLCNDLRINFKNPTGYCNKELDAIAEKANTAKQSERKQYYKQYAEIVARDLNEIPLTNTGQTHAVSTRFANHQAQFEVSFDGYPNWAEVWLK